MEAGFWLKKWELGETGFHQELVNESLRACWPSVKAPPEGAVLVPLCGKSLDMCWLVDRGHTVIGIEVSSLACEAFFAGLKVKPQIEKVGALTGMSAGPYRILQGDFFAVTPADVGPVPAFYDRAAIVAMPPEMQPVYARQLMSLLPAGAVGLVNCVDYPPEAMEGPPFSIDEERLRELLRPHCEVARLASKEVETAGTALEGRGLAGLEETVYRVRRKP